MPLRYNPTLWYNIPGVLVAYQPVRAPSLAWSYYNQARGGDNRGSAVLGVAPTWNDASGWIFDGISQYLIGPSLNEDCSYLLQFSNLSGDWTCIFGEVTQFTVWPRFGGNNIYAERRLQGYLDPLNIGITDNVGMAERDYYRNGVWQNTVADNVAGSWTTHYLACRNSGGPGNYCSVYIQAFVAWSRILSSGEIYNAARQMAYCHVNSEWSAWSPKRKWYYVKIGATIYTYTVAGTLTSAGATIKQIRKTPAGTLTSGGLLAAVRTRYRVLAGTLTSVGTLVAAKTMYRTLAGMLMSAGILIKQAQRSLAGTLTSNGALIKAKTLYRTVAGALTSAGALVKRTQKSLAGTLSSSGTLTSAKTFYRTIAGVLGSAGSLVKTTYRILNGTLTNTGALIGVKTFYRTLVGALSAEGVLVKQTQRTLAGSLSGAGVLSSAKTLYRTLAGTLMSAGAVVKQTRYTLSGALTSVGAKITQARRTLVGALASGGALSKQAQHSLSGVLSSGGSLTGAKTLYRILAGTLASGGALQKTVRRAIGGVLFPRSAIGRSLTRTLSGVLGSGGAISKQTRRILSGILDFLASVLGIRIPGPPVTGTRLTLYGDILIRRLLGSVEDRILAVEVVQSTRLFGTTDGAVWLSGETHTTIRLLGEMA